LLDNSVQSHLRMYDYALQLNRTPRPSPDYMQIKKSSLR
jgi:hypothetical protein